MPHRRSPSIETAELATYHFPFAVRLALEPWRRDQASLWWATRTPEGPGTLRLLSSGPRDVEAFAWGPGRHWLLRQVPPLLGSADRPEHFVPQHRTIEREWRSAPLRLGRTDRVFDATVAAVMGIRVQRELASRSLALLARRHGDPAPGPNAGLYMLPEPARLARLSYPQLHQCGLERSRAEVLRRVGAEASRLEAAAADGGERLAPRLLAMPGVGPWTVATVLSAAFGDPDAVPVGDYHLPHMVCWALAGEERGTDARMAELLEPYAGQRGRVVALLMRAGIRPPRRATRRALLPVDRFDGTRRGIPAEESPAEESTLRSDGEARLGRSHRIL